MMAFFTRRHKIDQHPYHWSSLTLSRRAALPSCPGIYAALKGRQILYIGKSTNLRDRWLGRSHHRYEQLRRQGRCRLHWVVLSREAIDAKERELIHKWQPTLNNTPVPTYSLWKTLRQWRFQILVAVGLLPVILFSDVVLDLAQQLYEFGLNELRP